MRLCPPSPSQPPQAEGGEGEGRGFGDETIVPVRAVSSPAHPPPPGPTTKSIVSANASVGFKVNVPAACDSDGLPVTVKSGVNGSKVQGERSTTGKQKTPCLVFSFSPFLQIRAIDVIRGQSPFPPFSLLSFILVVPVFCRDDIEKEKRAVMRDCLAGSHGFTLGRCAPV